MKKLIRKISLWYRRERPVLVGAAVAIANAVQVAAIPMPTWLHSAVAVVSILLGAGNVRQGVTPAPGASGKPDVASDALLSDEAKTQLGLNS